MEYKDLLDLPVRRVYRAFKECKDYRANQATLASLARPVILAQQGPLACKARLVQIAQYLAQQALQDSPEYRVFKAFKAK